jgi:ketosteroid isomerase-like protein
MPATPTEVATRLLDGISAGRWDRLAELYADDAVVEIPFAGPGGARVTGRDEVQAHFTAAARGPLRFTAEHVVIHRTDDPEVVVSEFDYSGRTATTGKPFRFRNIQVLRVRDGRIVESRDYHDHQAIARALDPNPA